MQFRQPLPLFPHTHIKIGYSIRKPKRASSNQSKFKLRQNGYPHIFVSLSTSMNTQYICVCGMNWFSSVSALLINLHNCILLGWNHSKMWVRRFAVENEHEWTWTSIGLPNKTIYYQCFVFGQLPGHGQLLRGVCRYFDERQSLPSPIPIIIHSGPAFTIHSELGNYARIILIFLIQSRQRVYKYSMRQGWGWWLGDFGVGEWIWISCMCNEYSQPHAVETHTRHRTNTHIIHTIRNTI